MDHAHSHHSWLPHLRSSRPCCDINGAGPKLVTYPDICDGQEREQLLPVCATDMMNGDGDSWCTSSSWLPVCVSKKIKIEKETCTWTLCVTAKGFIFWTIRGVSISHVHRARRSALNEGKRLSFWIRSRAQVSSKTQDWSTKVFCYRSFHLIQLKQLSSWLAYMSSPCEGSDQVAGLFVVTKAVSYRGN